MRQIWITKHGAPEVLAVREAPDPEPGPGELRIRVKAAGINFADLMARVGLYPDAPKPPCVVGYEVSGVIDRVGPGVTELAEGDRVFGMPKFGGYTDTLVIGARQAFRLPAPLNFFRLMSLYELIDRNPLFSFQPIDVISHPSTIAAQHRMVSVTQARMSCLSRIFT